MLFDFNQMRDGGAEQLSLVAELHATKLAPVRVAMPTSFNAPSSAVGKPSGAYMHLFPTAEFVDSVALAFACGASRRISPQRVGDAGPPPPIQRSFAGSTMFEPWLLRDILQLLFSQGGRFTAKDGEKDLQLARSLYKDGLVSDSMLNAIVDIVQGVAENESPWQADALYLLGYSHYWVPRRARHARSHFIRAAQLGHVPARVFLALSDMPPFDEADNDLATLLQPLIEFNEQHPSPEWLFLIAELKRRMRAPGWFDELAHVVFEFQQPRAAATLATVLEHGLAPAGTDVSSLRQQLRVIDKSLGLKGRVLSQLRTVSFFEGQEFLPEGHARTMEL